MAQALHGLMMQEELLLEDRTVLENVMLPALAADETAQEARRRALLASTSAAPLISPTFVPRASQLANARSPVWPAPSSTVPCSSLPTSPRRTSDKTNAQTLINLLSAFALAGVTVVAATHQHLTPEGCRSREITLSASNRGGAA